LSLFSLALPIRADQLLFQFRNVLVETGSGEQQVVGVQESLLLQAAQLGFQGAAGDDRDV
jgi:hypothetical protein